MRALHLEAGAAHRFIVQRERLGCAGADEPAVFARHGADAEHRAGAGVEQGVGDAVLLAQQQCGLIQRIAFADGTEVNEHVIGARGDGEFLRVQFQQVIAAAGFGLLQFVLRRLARRAVAMPQHGVERADGDIEGPAGLLPDFLAVGQAIHRRLVNVHHAPGFTAVEPSDVAVSDEAAELLLQRVYVIPDFLRGTGGEGRVLMHERDLEARGHRFVAVAVQDGRGHGGFKI